MEKEPGLKRGVLGIGDITFQGISHISPALGVIFTVPFVAQYAGAAVPISLLISVVICLFIANTVAEFSKYITSSGGYYTFVTLGLGRRFGFMTAWSYFFYDPLGPAAVSGFLGYFVQTTIQGSTGVLIPWWIWSLVSIVIYWVLTTRGVSISTRATVILGVLELVIMIALCITFLIIPGKGADFAAPFKIGSGGHGLSGILYGVIFSILALSGFESTAQMSVETKNPGKFIYKATMVSLIIAGIFFLFTSYSSIIGWGSDIKGFSTNDNPYMALSKKLWGVGWIAIFFAMINSCLANGIASSNAATRVMYTMAKIDVLPVGLKKIHPKYGTPTRAINLQMLITLVLTLGIGLWLGALQVFAFLGAIITVAIIIMYVLGNIALIKYIRREHPEDFRYWRHGILPILASLFLLPVLWVTFYPIPAYPLNLVPYIVIVWMIIGFIVMRRVEKRREQSEDPLNINGMDSEPF